MKPRFFYRQILTDLIAFAVTFTACGISAAQQNVFHRSEVATGDWGSGLNPWFWQTNNENRGDPDSNSSIRNDVFIGHNNQLAMTLNGRFYIHRDFTFQEGASAQRTLGNSAGGGFSFSRSLINQSSATHIFNTPLGIDGAGAEIRADNASGGLTFNGSIFTNDHTVCFRGPGTVTLAGAMTQGGSLLKQGTGTLVITGDANFSGSLFIDGGKLTLNRTVGTGFVDIGAGVQDQTANAATLEINAGIDIARAINVKNTGTGAGERSIIFTNQTGTATLSGSMFLEKTVVMSSQGTDALVSGAISGAGGINISGPGAVTFSGTNQYTGATSVSQGTLVINGNQSSATGAVSVTAGAFLRGTGTIGGDTAVAGTHGAGSTTGQVANQSFSGNLSYSSGSIFEWDLNAPSVTSGYDTVTGTGSRTMSVAGGVINIVLGSGADFSNGFWNQSRTWAWNEIFKGFNSLTTFSAFSVTNAPSPSLGSFTVSGTGVEWVAVPEPTTALAGLLLCAGLFTRHRRAPDSAR